MFRSDPSRPVFFPDVLAALAGFVLSTFAYFVVPFGEFGGIGTWGFVALFLVGLIAVGGLIIRQVRRYRLRTAGRAAPIVGVVASLYLAVLFFAAMYYSLTRYQPLAIESLHTKLDALYFALSVTTTVGFGDIHAVSQLARAMVTIHLAFNIGFLGAAVSIVRATGRYRR
jgi:voltage-gated potassium channel